MDSSTVIAMSFVMISVGVIFLWMLFKDNETKRPRDIVEWVGTVLSCLLIVSAVALILVSKKANVQTVVVQQSAGVGDFQDMIMEVPAGDFSFKAVDSDVETSLSDLRGKVVIINFWATWCGPCLAEIPDLNRLQDEFGDEGLVILSVSDEDRFLLQDFENRLELVTESVYVPYDIDLPTPFTGAFIIRPASFVIDREGVVRRYLLGARDYQFFKRADEPLLIET